MACPYFIPKERLELGCQHPERLPLGAGWTGNCGAPGQMSAQPTDQELRENCNLGHARCHRLPRDRDADAIRFVAKPLGAGRISVQYVLERECLPAGHGVLEYDVRSGTWTGGTVDGNLQRQAECFLSAWQSRRV